MGADRPQLEAAKGQDTILDNAVCFARCDSGRGVCVLVAPTRSRTTATCSQRYNRREFRHRRKPILYAVTEPANVGQASNGIRSTFEQSKILNDAKKRLEEANRLMQPVPANTKK